MEEPESMRTDTIVGVAESGTRTTSVKGSFEVEGSAMLSERVV
jgi:hypothetical protein